MLASPLRILIPRGGPLSVSISGVDFCLSSSCSLRVTILFAWDMPSSVFCLSYCLVLSPELGSSATDIGIVTLGSGFSLNMSSEKEASFVFKLFCTVYWLLVPELLAAVEFCSLVESKR